MTPLTRCHVGLLTYLVVWLLACWLLACCIDRTTALRSSTDTFVYVRGTTTPRSRSPESLPRPSSTRPSKRAHSHSLGEPLLPTAPSPRQSHRLHNPRIARSQSGAAGFLALRLPPKASRIDVAEGSKQTSGRTNFKAA